MDIFNTMLLRLACFFVMLLYAFVAYAQYNFESMYSPVFIRNQMDWSIAGNIYGENPNILSELKFKDVFSVGGTAQLKYRPIKHLIMTVNVKKLKTVSGKGSDIDYTKSNREEPNYILDFNSSKGDILNYFFSVTTELNFLFNVQAGIIHNNYQQKYFLTSNQYKDLNSYYDYKSKQYGIIFSKRYPILSKIEIENEVILNRVVYHSDANWNLIKKFQQPKSFEHKANGYFLGINTKIFLPLNSKLSLVTQYEHHIEKTRKGIDMAYLTNKDIQYSQFNGSKRKYQLWSFGLGYKFF